MSGLSWLPVSFLLHVHTIVSYHMPYAKMDVELMRSAVFLLIVLYIILFHSFSVIYACNMFVFLKHPYICFWNGSQTDFNYHLLSSQPVVNKHKWKHWYVCKFFLFWVNQYLCSFCLCMFPHLWWWWLLFFFHVLHLHIGCYLCQRGYAYACNRCRLCIMLWAGLMQF